MAATVQRPARWYTSREAVKAFFGLAATDKDARVDAHIAQASALIEQHTGRIFIPKTATKEFDYQGTSQLILGDDLLAVTTLSADGTTISSGDYFLYPLNALDDGKPYLWIELLFTSALFQFSDTKQSAISLLGKWGYCELTRDISTLAEDIDASETAWDVTELSDFDIGQTLLADTEQVFVKNRSASSGAGTLTVKRAMNGTTAATHTNGATLYAIDPPADIQFACNVLVARFLHRGDAAWSDRAGDPAQGFTYYRNLPTEVKDIFKKYKRLVRAPIRLMQPNAVIGRYARPGEDGQ